MNQCWEWDPSNRPSFKALHDSLSEIHVTDNSRSAISLDINPDTYYYKLVSKFKGIIPSDDNDDSHDQEGCEFTEVRAEVEVVHPVLGGIDTVAINLNTG